MVLASTKKMSILMSHIETKLIHAGKQHNETRSVVPPIYQTATYFAPSEADDYIIAATEVQHPYFYHRHGNATHNQVADIIAGLESTESALLTATGMAAISTAILSVVKSGDHIVAQQSHYSAAKVFLTEVLPDFGVTVTLVDQNRNEAFTEAIQENTRLIYVETPSNPNLALTDLAFVGNLGKEKKIVTMCDNTFACPLNQQPSAFGIDIIVHSATKYLGGHSDLTAGAICGSAKFIQKAWKRMLSLGGALAPFDTWLLLRGLRTLTMRVRQINENAQQLAEWLEKQTAIKQVIYCGLPSHPQHDLAKQQMSGFTGMLCVELAGETEKIQFQRAQTVLNSFEIFANAASLGGVESLAVHPASMWGMHHSKEQKEKAGINDGMLRISVGIEHIDDIISDFEQALAKI